MAVIQMNRHIPVMLDEAIDYLRVRPDGTYVDMTLGGGGHARAILDALDGGRLIAFDKDADAIKKAKKKLNDDKRLTIVQSDFRHLKDVLGHMGINRVDGILFDLGVSSFQFDIPERGFSYRYDAPLDMRMDQDQALTARDVVNTYDDRQLSDILFKYGEERYAKRIARTIVEQRKDKPIETTFDLVDVIKQALPERVLRSKGHPAKQTFQAIRIEVNDELGALRETLHDAIDVLDVGGRLVTISFHSLEDRICKHVFRDYATLNLPKGLPVLNPDPPILKCLTRKVVRPGTSETEENLRAHSAKLRAVEKQREG
jgi:16S rRNA (cytosine1402-N4)-methyltransferase